MVDEDGGLFSIAIDSDEDGSSSEAAVVKERRPRDHQTEEEFHALRNSYRAKVQNGEIWQTIELPLATAGLASKPVLQEILHAVEELYFLRRFGEAAAFARRVLDGSEAALDRDTRAMLVRYEDKCRGRARAGD